MVNKVKKVLKFKISKKKIIEGKLRRIEHFSKDYMRSIMNKFEKIHENRITTGVNRKKLLTPIHQEIEAFDIFTLLKPKPLRSENVLVTVKYNMIVHYQKANKKYSVPLYKSFITKHNLVNKSIEAKIAESERDMSSASPIVEAREERPLNRNITITPTTAPINFNSDGTVVKLKPKKIKKDYMIM